MSWWTEEQDDVLREVSFHGAAFAAALSVVLMVLTSLMIRLYRRVTHVKDLEGML